MKRSTLIIIGVLSASVAVMVNQKFFAGRGDNSRSPLDAVASSVNAKLPMQVDKHTRWDSTVALPGNVFCYYYTLTGVDASKIDKAAFKSHLLPILTATYKTNPDMQSVRDFKANLKYVYRAEDGTHLIDIDVPFSSISP